MTSSDPSRPPMGLDILDKADALIKALEECGTASAAKLAETVDEPVSSTYRLLASLAALGWVERGRQRGTYHLGIYLLKVGGVCEDDLDMREAIRPVLQGLHAASGMTCLLWVRRGQRAVCIDRIEGPSLRLSAVRLGDSLPLWVGGGPRSLLAQLPQGERAGVLAALASDDEMSASGIPETPSEEVLAEDRRRGWVGNDRVPPAYGPAIAEIAAPVANHRGELAASIAIRALRPLLMDRETELSGLVVRAAREAAVALGAPAEESVHG